MTRRKFVGMTAGAVAGMAMPMSASVWDEITRKRTWSSHKLLSYGDMYENNPTISAFDIATFAAGAALWGSSSLGVGTIVMLADKGLEFWQEKNKRAELARWRPENGQAPIIPAPRIIAVDADTKKAIDALAKLDPKHPLDYFSNQTTIEEAWKQLEKKELPSNKKDQARRLAIMVYVLIHLGRTDEAQHYADQAARLAKSFGNDSPAFILGLDAISMVKQDPVLQAEKAVETLRQKITTEDCSHFIAPAFFSSVGQNIALFSRSSHLRGTQALEMLFDFASKQFDNGAPNSSAYLGAASCAYLTALAATSADLHAYEDMKDSPFLDDPISIVRFDAATTAMERLLNGSKCMAAMAGKLKAGPDRDMANHLQSGINKYETIVKKFRSYVWTLANKIENSRVLETSAAKSIPSEVRASVKSRAQTAPDSFIFSIRTARIVRIEHRQSFVIINLGEYHRVETGSEWIVFRGSKKIGKLKVTQVTSFHSICNPIGNLDINVFERNDEALKV